MNEHIEKALADLRARQTAGEWMPCPRCGRDTMKPALHTNALSRHADGIYICDECGSAEAMLDFMNNPLPTEMWAIFRVPRPENDLRDLTGAELWERIRVDHGLALIDLYERWTQEAPGASFTPYRWEAFKRCLGAALPGKVHRVGRRADPAPAAHRQRCGGCRRPAGEHEVNTYAERFESGSTGQKPGAGRFFFAVLLSARGRDIAPCRGLSSAGWVYPRPHRKAGTWGQRGRIPENAREKYSRSRFGSGCIS